MEAALLDLSFPSYSLQVLTDTGTEVTPPAAKPMAGSMQPERGALWDGADGQSFSRKLAALPGVDIDHNISAFPTFPVCGTSLPR